MMNESVPARAGLSAEESKRFQKEMLWALSEQLGRYTAGESSSVLSETAEKVLESMLYCVSVELSARPDPAAALREIPAAELFRRGAERVKSMTEDLKLLYRQVLNTRIPTDLIAYNETLDGAIPGFFKTYDPEYAAHENGALTGFPDYPLLNDDQSRGGILYMKNYMEELLRENRFCTRYKKNYIRAVLLLHGRSCHLDYRELIVNIPELILEREGAPKPYRLPEDAV
ncbi:DUF6179 domain-containing protein [Caproicibacter sp.]|uniref:DUF6179 domain-containing protein n=1 Tax=Caproicibacter sp. TaxID=2814884 RepID=UPI00398A4569